MRRNASLLTTSTQHHLLWSCGHPWCGYYIHLIHSLNLLQQLADSPSDHEDRVLFQSHCNQSELALCKRELFYLFMPILLTPMLASSHISKGKAINALILLWVCLCLACHWMMSLSKCLASLDCWVWERPQRQLIAHALGWPSQHVDLGGVHDEAEILKRQVWCSVKGPEGYWGWKFLIVIHIL